MDQSFNFKRSFSETNLTHEQRSLFFVILLNFC